MKRWQAFDIQTLVSVSKLYKGKYYDDNIYTLDIETTSIFKSNDYLGNFNPDFSSEFYEACEKIGFMYIWQMSINEQVYYGRTWNELYQFLDIITTHLHSRPIIYIHNLAFEFQFMRNMVNDWELFARKSRHPIVARSHKLGAEFRCTLMLTNMSLAKLPDAYNLPIEKMTGDLDYTKIRTQKTKLTKKELNYCEHDCLVLYHLIKQMKEKYRSCAEIPLTQTGRLRRVVKRMYTKDTNYYRRLTNMLPADFTEFDILTKAYQGGYTHANALYTNQILEKIGSMDITSSYPTVMVAENYPMSRFIPTKIIDFNNVHEGYNYIFDITFYDIQATMSCTYLARSKAIEIYNAQSDNGRIVTADSIRYILTDIDLNIVKQCYKFTYHINNAYMAFSGKLDKKLVSYILELYNNKTQYKGLPEKIDLYKQSKEYINAMYGMTVTNTIRDNILFNDDWNIHHLTVDEVNDKLQAQKQRHRQFLSYAWGIYVTAYARSNLWNVILQIPDRVVYTDTDSIKYIGNDISAFTKYNKDIVHKLENACSYYGIGPDLTRPKDTKGKIRQLGIYDYEGTYDYFITQGAKKYCTQTDNELEITLAGVNKKKGLSAINSVQDFKPGLIFDYNKSGRLILSYNDEQPKIYITDYQGHKTMIDQQYGINMMPTTYELNLSSEYQDYLTGLTFISSSHLQILQKESEKDAETEIL